MTARHDREVWLWATISLMAVTWLILVISIISSDSKDMSIIGGDFLSRDALYQASATVAAFAVFSSVLAYGFRGKPSSKNRRKGAVQAMFTGLMLVIALQVILMMFACCWHIIPQSLMFSIVFGTFVAMTMFGVGIFLLVREMLEGETQS